MVRISSTLSVDHRVHVDCESLLGVGRDSLPVSMPGPTTPGARMTHADAHSPAGMCNRGVARGELDPKVDPEVALDLIFGAAVYRMATGHGGLTPHDADAIVATAMRALAS